MKAIIIVGNTGRGKTTAALKTLYKAIDEKRKIFVYDPNNDFREFYNKPFTDEFTFLNSVKDVQNSYLLFEEATIFFSNKGNDRTLRSLLVRKRHQNNTIVLLFHSLRSIPIYIFELTNYLVLYKTADNENLILKKFEGFPEITEAYQKLKNVPDDNKHNFHLNYVIEINKPVSLLSSQISPKQKTEK
jgi:hypothetical protein